MKKNAILVILAQCINYALPLIIFPILARRLGVEFFGIFGFIFSVVGYMCLIVDYGFNMGGTKILSEKLASFQPVSDDFWAIWLAKFLIFTFMFIVFLVFGKLWLTSLEYWLIFISFMQVLGYILNVNWYFQANEKVGISTILLVIGKALSLPLFLIYVQDKGDISKAVLIQSGSILFASLLTMILLFYDKTICELNLVSLRLTTYYYK